MVKRIAFLEKNFDKTINSDFLFYHYSTKSKKVYCIPTIWVS